MFSIEFDVKILGRQRNGKESMNHCHEGPIFIGWIAVRGTRNEYFSVSRLAEYFKRVISIKDRHGQVQEINFGASYLNSKFCDSLERIEEGKELLKQVVEPVHRQMISPTYLCQQWMCGMSFFFKAKPSSSNLFTENSAITEERGYPIGKPSGNLVQVVKI